MKREPFQLLEKKLNKNKRPASYNEMRFIESIVRQYDEAGLECEFETDIDGRVFINSKPKS